MARWDPLLPTLAGPDGFDGLRGERRAVNLSSGDTPMLSEKQAGEAEPAGPSLRKATLTATGVPL